MYLLVFLMISFIEIVYGTLVWIALSPIGGLILWGCARGIAKIEKATFLNSWGLFGILISCQLAFNWLITAAIIASQSFIVVVKGKALILDSLGNKIKKEIFEHQSYGLIDILKENKWKNTIISENKSVILFIPRDILIKNLFYNRTFTGITLNLLKMAS